MHDKTLLSACLVVASECRTSNASEGARLSETIFRAFSENFGTVSRLFENVRHLSSEAKRMKTKVDEQEVALV